MNLKWTTKPDNAWLNHIRPNINQFAGWLEDSSNISQNIMLSKRELFGLILLAYAYGYPGKKWRVGYDKADEEPNDGFIINGNNRIRVEHKIVAQFDKREALDAILKTYSRAKKRGPAYGSNRTLIIYVNKAAKHGLIKISTLKDQIKNESTFDQVFSIGLVCYKRTKNIGIFHVLRHFHRLKEKHPNLNRIIQIDFNFSTGKAKVYNGYSSQ